MRPGTQRVQTQRAGDTIVAAVSGELDMNATFHLEPELERVAQEPGVRNVVIDLGGVEFIDSAGLGILLATQERCRACEVGFRLANPSPSVRRILHLTGAGIGLPVSDDEPG
jgi:anti-anti-sigma factor